MKTNGHLSALLLEMVVVLVLFTVAAVVLSGVFAACYRTERTTKARDEAVLAAQNIAEEFRMGNAPDESDGFTRVSEGVYEKDCGTYTLRVTLAREETGAGTLDTATITSVMTLSGADEEELLSLPVSRYTAGEVTQ